MPAINAVENVVDDLLVCDIDKKVVRAFEERAVAHGRRDEAEHHEILATALVRLRRESSADDLADMPNLGVDADFER